MRFRDLAAGVDGIAGAEGSAERAEVIHGPVIKERMIRGVPRGVCGACDLATGVDAVTLADCATERAQVRDGIQGGRSAGRKEQVAQSNARRSTSVRHISVSPGKCGRRRWNPQSEQHTYLDRSIPRNLGNRAAHKASAPSASCSALVGSGTTARNP